MKGKERVIDVHMHYNENPGFHYIAEAAHHQNTPENVQESMEENGIVMCIAMGTGRKERREAHLPGLIDLAGPLDPVSYNQGDNICYCLGINSEALNRDTLPFTLREARRHLETCDHCVGLKMYPGYNYVYLSDPRHEELYALAEEFDVPVMIHSGETASATALLKYSHPLTVDEVAVTHPNVRFVLCHMGNPWVMDACEMALKNPNVYLDLSGLGEGFFTKDQFLENYAGYVEYLKTWMQYLGRYDKIMYGTDWPLVNMKTYLETMRAIIPQKYHRQVFYENALTVFPRVRALLEPKE